MLAEKDITNSGTTLSGVDGAGLLVFLFMGIADTSSLSCLHVNRGAAFSYIVA